MKIRIILLLFLLLLPAFFVSAAVPPATDEEQQQAVIRLTQRRFPAVADIIHYKIVPSNDGSRYFEADSTEFPRITITGSDGVALAQGLHWYMKHINRQHLSWCGSRVTVTPETMNRIPEGIFRQKLPFQRIAYMNYCTFGYSAPWWDWERWEWEIDFMALNGVNMPLAATGLEAVWYHTLRHPEIGLSDEEARRFLVPPSHMPWQWMQNIENETEPPLPKEWIDSHTVLAKQILEREHSFGMMPIQQGFSGYVPRIFTEKFPDAVIRIQPDWCGWPGVAQLDPTDPLFRKFGKLFIEEQIRLFGGYGYYAADPFHESAPPKDIPVTEIRSYLNEVGTAVYETIQSADPDAVWVMQSWSIRKDIACAAPRGKVLILDLDGKRRMTTAAFWKHDFLNGQLHNFGGRINLHGDIARLCRHPALTVSRLYPNTNLGTGLFMEGIIQNPVFYDALFDMWWRTEPVRKEEWIRDYAERRYGGSSEKVLKAWGLLLKGPYRPGTDGVEKSSIIAARPAVKAKKSGPTDGFSYYKPDLTLKAARLLLEESDRLGDSDGYRFDIADLTRQNLSNLAWKVHLQMQKDFSRNDIDSFEKHAEIFRHILLDTDRICNTRKEYRYSEWLSNAEKHSSSEAGKNYLKKNAALLVTAWGPEGDPEIYDYSWREWSGLIRYFYAERWKIFHRNILKKMKAGENYDESGLPQTYGREAWRANEIYDEIADFEEDFIIHPPAALFSENREYEDEIETAKELMSKWQTLLDKML